MNYRILCLGLLTLTARLPLACANPSLERVLVHPEALNIQRHEFPASESRQTSYVVKLEYPAVAVSDGQFKQLEAFGWQMCRESQKDWDSFVDASQGEGREETVFQRLSYFRKADVLLTIVLRYHAAAGLSGSRLPAPTTQDQHVVILETTNVDARMWLEVCHDRS